MKFYSGESIGLYLAYFLAYVSKLHDWKPGNALFESTKAGWRVDLKPRNVQYESAKAGWRVDLNLRIIQYESTNDKVGLDFKTSILLI